MSLQVWLPLNGDLNNYGLDNVTITNKGAAIDNSGKIGKCYTLDGNSQRICCSKMNYSYPLSIAAWVKPTAVTSTLTQYILSYNTDSGGTSGQLLSLGMLGSSKLVVWFGGISYHTNFDFQNNVWTHICATLDINKKMTVYVNGEEIDSQTFSTDAPASSWFTIGARSDSSTGGAGSAVYFFKGSINDIRFYNNALSPKEVKEISKSLILHYPLNYPYVANKEFDCGISNIYDGAISGNYNFEDDSPRRSKSFKSESTSTIYADNVSIQNPDGITFSFWRKPVVSVDSAEDLSSILISSTENGTGAGFKCWTYQNYPYFSIGSTNIKKYTNYWSDGNWHLMTCTYNKNKMIIYIDGVSVIEGDCTNDFVFTNNKLYIQNKNELISDFRIYATALSKDDILELYHTAAMIDNDNNMYTYEFIDEKEVTNVKNTGIITAKAIINEESGKAKIFNNGNIQAESFYEI